MKNCVWVFLLFLCACTGTQVNSNETKTTKPVALKDTTPQYRVLEITETIPFEHNSFKINPASLPLLKKLASICTSDSISMLRVFGFTDTVGTQTHNDKLAEQRTMAVYKLLDSAQVITPPCLYIDWLGESADVYDLHFRQAHPQQNIVDIWIVTRKKTN